MFRGRWRRREIYFGARDRTGGAYVGLLEVLVDDLEDLRVVVRGVNHDGGIFDPGEVTQAEIVVHF